MIKVILFDVDGVLVRNVLMFSKRLYEEHGITPDQTKPFFEGPFKDCLLGTSDLKKVIRPYLKKWGWKKSVNELLDFWFEGEKQTDKNILDHIQYLRSKGIKCFIATNQEGHRAKYMLKAMGFLETFDGMFASARLGVMKNDNIFYKKVINDLKEYKKDEILFWDDSQENIDTARKFGLHAELYKTFESYKKQINSYLQLR